MQQAASEPMASLNYLTVQDILWINLQLTKKVQRYNFARLEEATFYQYAYGESKNVIDQAARFFPGFQKMHPFEVANKATAFVALVTFLELNGFHFNIADGKELTNWIETASEKQKVRDSICNATDLVEDDHHSVDMKSTISGILSRYEKTIEKLVEVGDLERVAGIEPA